jgi:hypothetical protein
MKCLQIIILAFCGFFATNTFAQSGYQKDSLQIKVYTQIEYKDNYAKDIRIDKVFCDYCSEYQMEKIKEEAKKIAYYERNEKRNRLINGIKKLTLYIRVSKKDLLELKEEIPLDSINNNKL